MAHTWFAATPERMVGCLMVGLGLISLIWTPFQSASGEPSVQRAFGRAERVSQQDNPARFARFVRVRFAGSVTAFAIGFVLAPWF